MFRSKDHVILDDCILLHFSVDSGHQTSRRSGLVESIRACKNWSYGSKFVEGLGVEELAAGLFGKLKESAREVIANRVSKNEGWRFLRRNISALPSRDEY